MRRAIVILVLTIMMQNAYGFGLDCEGPAGSVVFVDLEKDVDKTIKGGETEVLSFYATYIWYDEILVVNQIEKYQTSTTNGTLVGIFIIQRENWDMVYIPTNRPSLMSTNQCKVF